MSLKKIIDAERWDRNVFDPGGKHNTASAHNASLDRIEAAVTERIKPSDGGEFELKIKNLRYMPESAKQILSDAHNADRAADKQRIAELEAQRPARVMKRWGLEGVPEKPAYYWIATSSRYEGIVLYDRPVWFSPNVKKEKWHGRKITHWLESEPTLIIPKDGDA